MVYTLISRTNPNPFQQRRHGPESLPIPLSIFLEQHFVFITRYSSSIECIASHSKDACLTRSFLHKTLVVGLWRIIGAGTAQDIKVPRNQTQVAPFVALSIGEDLHACISVDVEKGTANLSASLSDSNAKCQNQAIPELYDLKDHGSEGDGSTDPLGTFIRKSFCAPCTKLATRNQLVFFSSPLPKLLPITYLTKVRSPLIVTSSGATPRRPTTVMRASWLAGEELKERVKARGVAVRSDEASMFSLCMWMGAKGLVEGDGE